MMRTKGLILGLILAVTAGNALAQVDCSGGCTTTKYGLGLKPDYRKDEVPPNVRRYPVSYFGPSVGGQSYFLSRTFETASNGSCGEERALSPLPGQIRLREQTGCTPTSEGPACSAGTNAGAICHLPTVNETCTAAGAPVACCTGLRTGTCSGFATGGFTNIVECGIGGVCSGTETGGCRVEIPSSDGGRSPETDVSEVRIFTLTFQAIAPNGDRYNLSASTGNGIGNSSFDGTWGISDCTGPGTPHECCFGPGQGYCQVNTTCLLSSATTQGAVRRKPSMGTRYILPANRGGNGTVAGGTYIRWDSVAGLARASFTDLATAFRILTDDTGVCCAANNPTLNTCTSAVPPATPNYPLLTKRTCGQEGRFVNEDNLVPDFIFLGGQATAFHTDDDFTVPGTIPGTCTNHRTQDCYSTNVNATCLSAGVNFRFGSQACCTGPGTGSCTANTFCSSAGQPYPCCTGAGAGTCGDPCPGLGDTCDLRSPGPRVQVGAGARDASNNPRFDFCGGSLYIIRATPNQGCALTPRTQYNGDPGPDCGVVNYGIDHRDDNNCDGVADNVDRCPRASEWDQDLDTDGDCGTPGSAGFPLDTCRGDECECGDQDGTATSGAEHIGNGRVNVSDIVGISLAQFGSQTPIRTCDGNGDTNCNVQDIIAANKEIFTPDSSICRQITPRQCGARTCQGGPTPGAACTLTSQCGAGGTCPFEAVGQPCCGQGKREFSELCDDNNLAPGDGCNAACRVEFQFTCTEDANGLSHCTHL